jgi:hypothetical protein
MDQLLACSRECPTTRLMPLKTKEHNFSLATYFTSDVEKMSGQKRQYETTSDSITQPTRSQLATEPSTERIHEKETGIAQHTSEQDHGGSVCAGETGRKGLDKCRSPKYVCTEGCTNIGFPNKVDLKKHSDIIHPKYICQEGCADARFTYNAELKQHRRAYHCDRHNPVLFCDRGCENRGFLTESGLKKHYETGHVLNPPRYDCFQRLCTRYGGAGFTRTDHLIQHMRNYHKASFKVRKPNPYIRVSVFERLASCGPGLIEALVLNFYLSFTLFYMTESCLENR